MEQLSDSKNEEIICRIENLGGKYDPNSNLSLEEQLEIRESLDETIKELGYEKKENDNVIVNGNGNDSYKTEVKSDVNWYKSELLLKLKKCKTHTSLNEIASLLEEIFMYWPPSKEKHWLWIAQNYTARTIIWVMSATVKEYLRGGIKKTPPAYFVYLLKFRKKRKEFRRNK